MQNVCIGRKLVDVNCLRLYLLIILFCFEQTKPRTPAKAHVAGGAQTSLESGSRCLQCLRLHWHCLYHPHAGTRARRWPLIYITYMITYLLLLVFLSLTVAVIINVTARTTYAFDVISSIINPVL